MLQLKYIKFLSELNLWLLKQEIFLLGLGRGSFICTCDSLKLTNIQL